MLKVTLGAEFLPRAKEDLLGCYWDVPLEGEESSSWGNLSGSVPESISALLETLKGDRACPKEADANQPALCMLNSCQHRCPISPRFKSHCLLEGREGCSRGNKMPDNFPPHPGNSHPLPQLHGQQRELEALGRIRASCGGAKPPESVRSRLFGGLSARPWGCILFQSELFSLSLDRSRAQHDPLSFSWREGPFMGQVRGTGRGTERRGSRSAVIALNLARDC